MQHSRDSWYSCSKPIYVILFWTQIARITRIWRKRDYTAFVQFVICVFNFHASELYFENKLHEWHESNGKRPTLHSCNSWYSCSIPIYVIFILNTNCTNDTNLTEKGLHRIRAIRDIRVQFPRIRIIFWTQIARMTRI